MTDPTPDQAPGRSPSSFAALCAAAGAACALIAGPFVMHEESGAKVYTHAYWDNLGGVWTVCSGDTQGVNRNTVETPAGCTVRLDKRLAAFVLPVLKCAPILRSRPYELAASLSLAYNIGARGYCHSSIARDFQAERWGAACDAFLLYDRAGGHVVAGLLNRRRAERALCLRGVSAA